jgi:D-glycero-D-manno-heptose 1,7-bisphosphate phosphatase
LEQAARRAVFLDRDGTLIEDVGYLSDANDIRVLPTVTEALRRFEAAGFLRIVVSNQSGIARGFFDEARMRFLTSKLDELLAQEHASISATYFCPHLDEGCDCRKPLPGMLRRAAAEHGVDLARSVMIGDRGSDVQAGQAAGMPGIFVTTGPLTYNGPLPDATVSSLSDATEWVLTHVL